jgi:uncharacterized protein YeeX (DUF496 family)
MNPHLIRDLYEVRNSGGRSLMPKRRRCPHCRILFNPDPRLKKRQKTCGRKECRRNQKAETNRKWRLHHQDYFQGIYAQRREVYGTRAKYKKEYRKRNPDYVRRNAAFVRKYREKSMRLQSAAVSHTSRDLRLSLWKERGSISITHVSHTSRDIHVSICEDVV